MTNKANYDYWDSSEEIGPQPPCAGAELDNETGLMPYSSDTDLAIGEAEEKPGDLEK